MRVRLIISYCARFTTGLVLVGLIAAMLLACWLPGYVGSERGQKMSRR